MTTRPCPKCHDTKHQELKQRLELGGVEYEVWNCSNPASSGWVGSGECGCGSHTHEIEKGGDRIQTVHR